MPKTPKRPLTSGWINTGIQIEMSGARAEIWDNLAYRTRVLSSVAHVPDEQYHLSVNAAQDGTSPMRASDEQCKRACLDFGMREARENSPKHIVSRHFWVPVNGRDE